MFLWDGTRILFPDLYPSRAVLSVFPSKLWGVESRTIW